MRNTRAVPRIHIGKGTREGMRGGWGGEGHWVSKGPRNPRGIRGDRVGGQVKQKKTHYILSHFGRICSHGGTATFA